MKTIVVLLFISSFFIFSCNEENDTVVVKVRLTDAPGEYDAVNVEIQNVQIHAGENEDEGGWHNLDIMNPGIYNLLDFNNGLDTLLGTAELPAGNISQMRLYLGENNTLVKDGATYNLNTTAGERSGLKLLITRQFEPGVTYTMWIDFDAARSVVDRGNGNYNLKPVIRVFTEATSGSIEGVIDPVASTPYVQAINATDTIGTIANANGYFLLRGVPEGTYKINFQPADGYVEKSIDNIEVLLGIVTNMDTVKIEQSL